MIKYLFIDMDNTIAENTTCDNIDFYDGLYLNKRPIKIVINAIKQLFPNCIYIVISKTSGHEKGKLEKIKWLEEYFSEVDSVILINPDELKSKYIKEIIEKYNINPKECLLIDDKKSILQDCKKIGINVKYPQQIICNYEDIMGC